MTVDIHTGEIVAPLGDHEKAKLHALELTIQNGKDAIGKALATIRDGRLYREAHPSFKAYCQERWGISNRHANRQIMSFEVQSILGPMGPAEIPERQARELAPLLDDPERMREVYETAKEATGGKPTAAAIKAVRNTEPEVVEAEVVHSEHDDGEVEDTPSPSPRPARELVDVLEDRMPGARADLARSSLRARWSKDIAAAADIDLLDPQGIRAVLDEDEARMAINTLRRVAKWAARLEEAGRPGLRIVGGPND